MDNWIFEGLPRAEMWGPIERFALNVAADETLPVVLPCEFMFMGAHDEHFGRAYEYKHVESRRYLILRADLRLVQYDMPPGRERGHYRLSRRTRRTAVERLELAEFGGCLELERYCEQCTALIEMAGPARPGHPANQTHTLAPWREHVAPPRRTGMKPSILT
jgi:hypothetical protein